MTTTDMRPSGLCGVCLGEVSPEGQVQLTAHTETLREQRENKGKMSE